MRIAVYLRVSTTRQMQDQTIAQQLERLQSHIQAQGWAMPETNILRDDGYSGANLKRPGLDRLRDRAAAAEFDLVLITAPDRLARNYVHQVLLLEELQRHGCRVEFLDRPMSQDPHDQLLLQIRGAVAEYERTLIAERMRRGRLAKLRAGALLPWTRPPYGYRVDPERPRDPAGVRLDAAEAAIVAEIFAWYLGDNHSLLSVVGRLQTLDVPSPSGKKMWGLATLRGILTNPVYAGQVYAGRTRVRPPRIRRSATHPIGRPKDSQLPVPEDEWIAVAQVPAIVTVDQLAQVKAKLAHNQSFASRNNKTHQYLLRALVSCGKCAMACQARCVQPHNLYYICTGKARPRRRLPEQHCPSRYAPAGQLDELVWRDLCELLTHPDLIAQALSRAHGGQWLPQELQARCENLRKGQQQLQHQLDRLTEAYLSGIIPLPEYQRRRGELEQRLGALMQQSQQLREQVSRHSHVAQLTSSVEGFCRRVQVGLADATFERRRQLVELLIDRVVVTDEQVEIRYVIPTSPAGENFRFSHLRSDYFRAPDLIDPIDLDATQQIRVNLMPWRRDREPRFGVDRL
jgi:site-specific DNA recombinase